MKKLLDQEPRKVEVSGLLVELFRNPGGRPWITYLVIAICAAVWASLNLVQELSLRQRITELLLPSSVLIWSGAYWALVTSALVHFEFWHILFNMWWFKDFGTVLEPTLGRPKFLLFILAAAVVSSGAELAVASQTGVGFSGVLYALFGYLLAARHLQPAYQRLITKQTIAWLLGWLFLCLVLTFAGIWRIANAAHVAGFLFGYCLGDAFAARVRVAVNTAALSGLIAVTVLSVGYMPWSETWRHRDTYAKMIAIGQEAAAGNLEAQYRYSGILLQDGKKEEGLSWLKKSAAQEYVPAMSDLAWTLATDRNETFRNGSEAVRLAEKACRMTNWKEPQYVDTLAAAYAEVERWDEAVSTERRAIMALGAGHAHDQASFESRLQRYSRHEKMRE